MRTVGIKALKNDLSRHIRAVEAGETVRVTDRGRTVAEIVPPRGIDPHLDQDRQRILAQLIDEGRLSLARTPADRPLPKRRPCMPFDDLMRDFDEARNDRS